MEPIHYLRALRRRWWVIVVAILVAGVAAWITTTTVAPPRNSGVASSYAATSVMWDPGISAGAGQGSPITNLDSLAQVVSLPDVAAKAAQLMNYEGDPLALGAQVDASSDRTSGFLRITATAPDPKNAEKISAAFSHALIVYLGELKDQQIDQQQRLVKQQIKAVEEQGFGADVVASLRAELSQLALNRTTPISLLMIQQPKAQALTVSGFQPPQSRRSRVLLALLVGLLAGLALALVVERFDTKIRTRQAAEDAFGLPVLAEIPAIPRRRRKMVVTASHPFSRAANAFRLVGLGTTRWASDGQATGNGADAPRSPARTILVTSPEARDGKTTVAANLATAYAQTGSRVLVVSCDLRRPAIHEMFGVPDQPGLADILESANGDLESGAPLDIASYLEPCSVVRVAVLPSGGTPERPGELLGSPKMQRFLERLKKITDVVVLDCAPLVVASDVVPLLPQVDGVVLVARARKTREALAGTTATLLERLGANNAGVVLNDARDFSIPLAKRRMYRPPRKVRKVARQDAESRVPERSAAERVVHEPSVVEPLFQEPTRQEPMVHPPVAQEPLDKESVVQIPTSQEPTVHEPAVQEPTRPPVSQEPLRQPVEEQVIQEETPRDPAAREPLVEEPLPPRSKTLVQINDATAFNGEPQPHLPMQAASSEPSPQVRDPKVQLALADDVESEIRASEPQRGLTPLEDLSKQLGDLRTELEGFQLTVPDLHAAPDLGSSNGSKPEPPHGRAEVELAPDPKDEGGNQLV
jgi:capsular exopolysaccharide synthesis family protein